MQAIATALAFDTAAEQTRSGVPGRLAVDRIEVFDDLAAAAPAWRRLEELAPCSPYQRFDWANAWCATVGAGQRPLVALAYDRQQEPVALFPFVQRSSWHIRVARFIGGKDSNGNVALFAEPEAWDGSLLRSVLRTIGVMAGVDVFALQNQPAACLGRPNPFALLPWQPSPSGVALTRHLADARLSKHARKRLRQKTGWLESLGSVDVRRAATAADVDLFLAAYGAQRTDRAEAAGVAPPTMGQIAFYKGAAVGLRSGSACMELFALRCGPDIVATFGGTGFRGTYSGMILSVDARPAVARCSPGELLLRRVLPELALRGFTRFDLGIGEARYKDSICDEREPLFDCFVPVAAKGRVAAIGFSLAGKLKRRIKQSGPAFARAQSMASVARRIGSARFSRP